VTTEPHVIETSAQATVLLKPLRIEMLRLLAEPRTCPQLAEALGITMQKAWYHVKVLERAGLAARIGERKVRGLREGIYQASAASFALSPKLTERLAPLAEQRPPTVPTVSDQLALRADVELDPARRAAFLSELQQALHELARRHGAENAWDTQTFRLVLSCERV